MLTQGDSLYDIIDKRDHSSVQTQLLQTTYNPCPDTGLDSRTFFCRMNVSRSFRRQSGFGDHKVSRFTPISQKYDGSIEEKRHGNKRKLGDGN